VRKGEENMGVRKTIWAGTCSAIALLAAGPVLAQDQSTQVDELVVTGIRASLQQSIDSKRNADAVVDVITAEDVGKFPDKNVAEALQRVPGVTIQREFGEGERVSIRGTHPTLNRTLLNGHAIATADWFILDQLKASRSFNYLMLPSEIVGRVDVYKSPQADLDEGGIGGTVDVQTRNPLDLPNISFAGSAQAVYDEKADHVDPAGSALLSWHNENSTIGLLGAVIYQKRTFRRDGIEFLGYTERTLTDPDSGQVYTAVTPDLIGSALFHQERERIGGNFGIQLRPADGLELNLTGLYSRMQADNFNQNYMAWVSQTQGAQGCPTDPEGLDPAACIGPQFGPHDAVVQNGTLVAGHYNLTPGANGAVFDAIDRLAHTDTRSIDLDVNYEINPQWKIHGRVGYTDAVGETEGQPFWETNAPTGFTFDFRNGVPAVNFTDIDPTTADDEMALGWASNNRILNNDDEFYVFGDIERRLDGELGPFTAIKAGFKYTDHNRDVDVTYGQRRGLLGAGSTSCSGHSCSLADVADGLTPDNFLDGIALPGTLTRYLMASQDRIEQIYGALPPPGIWESTTPPGSAAGCAGLLNCNHFGPLESFTLNERTWGGYLMGEFKGENYRGNLGVRVVNTRERTGAWAVGVPAGTAGAISNPFGLIAPIEFEKEYTDILPSMNLVFDLRDNLLLRAAAARVISRPDYAQMAGFVSLTPLTLRGSGGNPRLEPYRANQFDIGLEWYYAPQSILAVDFFYKDISTFIVQGASVERQPLEVTSPSDPRVTTPGNNCVATGTALLYTCDYLIGRPVNVGGGHQEGIEVNWQQPVWNGFGVLANYTFLHSESDSGVPIPGSSKHAANLSAYYENDRFSARLSWNYRSKFFVDYDVERGFRPLYMDNTWQLDASFVVNVTKNLALTVDAQNLTDETIEEFYDDDPGRPARFYKNGRVFYAGVRAKF
jgi:iron complex outermembrane receptor protein